MALNNSSSRGFLVKGLLAGVSLVAVIYSAVVISGDFKGYKDHISSYSDAQPSLDIAYLEPAAGVARDEGAAMASPRMVTLNGGVSGKFLASHFAQARFDLATSLKYLEQILIEDPENEDLILRAMILSMAAGQTDAAYKYADQILKFKPDFHVAHMMRVVKHLENNDLKQAEIAAAAMPEGDISNFAKPLLTGWISAGIGNWDVKDVKDVPPVPLHIYHAALQAYLVGKNDKSLELANKFLSVKGITQNEAVRIADLLIVLGERDKALGMYHGIKMQGDGVVDEAIARRISALEANDQPLLESLIDIYNYKTAQKGAALALNDLALVLYQEDRDNSAILFSQMALAIDPAITDARVVISEIYVRNERYEEAIAILKTVPQSYPSFLSAQYRIAELMTEIGRTNAAVYLLNLVYDSHKDIEALIKIGDVYRHNEDFKNALTAYNRAFDALGQNLTSEYWHLLYARGMVLERVGRWDDAVVDLTKAVEYRPNHPFLLNYLGYGWADNGENLEKSLDMIARAVQLQPTDGYITDSLGWVLYRMGRYEEATPILERAVELLPYDPTINDHLGDAYWKVGRRLEARFQWRRAKNAATEEDMLASIDVKLKDGLPIEETKLASTPPEVKVKSDAVEKAVTPTKDDTVNELAPMKGTTGSQSNNVKAPQDNATNVDADNADKTDASPVSLPEGIKQDKTKEKPEASLTPAAIESIE
jgi:tetratricopeptide (TPR) repeat protein